ncbi:hypothetical protein KQI63_05805 [bacterium]|nr:hypothetical protein [bacterium]
MKPVELKGHTRLTIPLSGGMVTRYDPDRLNLGQAVNLVNLVHTRQGLLRRPAVQMVTATNVLDRLYSLHRWYAPDGHRYLLGLSPNNADPENANGLRLSVRKDDQLTADGAWTTLDDRFLLRVALRTPVSAVLRDLFVLSDTLYEIKYIEEIASDLGSVTGGPLGYLPPAATPVISSVTLGGSPEENAIPHGIYQLAQAFVYDDGEHSNPGPRSNVFGSVFRGRTANDLGLASIELTNVTQGNELDTATAARVLARSFPMRYKAFADDLFGDWTQREEKAGLTGTTHSSTDPAEGLPATLDNHLPPVPKSLVAVRDAMVAIGNLGPAPKRPWDSASGKDILTTRVARVVITNPNPRTETRVPVDITIPFSGLDGYTDQHSDGSDLVLCDDDQITVLPYIMSGYNGSEITFTVQLPELPASGRVTLYLHYEAETGYSSFESLWTDIFQPELTRRTDLAHFYMDEPDEDGPQNRAGDYPGEFLNSAAWASSGDPDGPPFNHNPAYDRPWNQDSFVVLPYTTSAVDLDSLGLTAFPVELGRLTFVRLTSVNLSGQLYSWGNNAILKLLDDNSTYASITLYSAGQTYTLTIGTGGELLNAWWAVGWSARRRDDGDWDVIFVAVNMATGDVVQDSYTASDFWTTGGGFSTEVPWRLGASSGSNGCQACVKNDRLFSYAPSAEELIALAARRGYLASDVDVAIETIDESTNERPDHSGRIYISKTGLPHAWPIDAEHLIRDEDDGGSFIAGAALHNALVAVKSNRIHLYRFDAQRAFWTDQENLDIVTQRVGLAGPRAWTYATLAFQDREVEVIAFLGSDRRVRAFDGQQLHWIGEPIDDGVANLYGTQLERTSLAFDPIRRLLLLSYPSLDSGGTPLEKSGGGGDDIPEDIDLSPAVIGDTLLAMSTEFFDPPILEGGSARPRWGSWLRSSDNLFPFGPHLVGSGPGDRNELIWAGAAWDDPRLYTLSDAALTDNWTGSGITIPITFESGLIPVVGSASWRSWSVDYATRSHTTRASGLLSTLYLRDPHTRKLSSESVRLTQAYKLLALPKSTLGDAVKLYLTGSDDTDRLELFEVEIEARPTGLRRGY